MFTETGEKWQLRVDLLRNALGDLACTCIIITAGAEIQMFHYLFFQRRKCLIDQFKDAAMLIQWDFSFFLSFQLWLQYVICIFYTNVVKFLRSCVILRFEIKLLSLILMMWFLIYLRERKYLMACFIALLFDHRTTVNYIKKVFYIIVVVGEKPWYVRMSNKLKTSSITCQISLKLVYLKLPDNT